MLKEDTPNKKIPLPCSSDAISFCRVSFSPWGIWAENVTELSTFFPNQVVRNTFQFRFKLFPNYLLTFIRWNETTIFNSPPMIRHIFSSKNTFPQSVFIKNMILYTKITIYYLISIYSKIQIFLFINNIIQRIWLEIILFNLI